MEVCPAWGIWLQRIPLRIPKGPIHPVTQHRCLWRQKQRSSFSNFLCTHYNSTRLFKSRGSEKSWGGGELQNLHHMKYFQKNFKVKSTTPFPHHSNIPLLHTKAWMLPFTFISTKQGWDVTPNRKWTFPRQREGSSKSQPTLKIERRETAEQRP